jgi:hypothetical protein
VTNLDLISIIARIGDGISKDSLSRFISSKCSDISEQNEVINSSSFAVASFDSCKSVNKIPQNWIYFLNLINQIEWILGIALVFTLEEM